MTRARIIEAVHAVLRDHMRHPHLAAFGPDARLNEDLYLDSVLMLQLFLNLELEFGLSAPDEAIAGDDLSTVSDLIALFDPDGAAKKIPAEIVSSPDGVHGEGYVDIKVHCFVSCVCAALKQAGVDHRPFYFGVWDADFAIGDDGALLYHAPSISHDFFRAWYERLYGIGVRKWYDHAKSKSANLAVLLDLLDRRSSTQSVMVMLDMYHLPERENKFNQNPFPHYLMLETTSDPDVWRVLDPDFRWEGEIEKDRVIHAICQPTVGGGFAFDRAEVRVPDVSDLAGYFRACFIETENPLTEGVRNIVRRHLDGRHDLGRLAAALREFPVISIRKYAYEHGFAFFWRALKLPDAEFQMWCDEIEKLANGFKALHYAVLRLSQTQDCTLASDVFVDLDTLDRLERRIKSRLSEVFRAWCAQAGVAAADDLQRRRAMA